ncbi:hypothetical protein Tco_0940178 [Tanacetum coccineum]|uniref:Uncharacterized protein n=1 Tax=Tanacetum coccineum TaxID=301880 RepID=A0ABQ5DN23_9ASTR
MDVRSVQGKGVVIGEIVEDGVVNEVEKEEKLLLWHGLTNCDDELFPPWSIESMDELVHEEMDGVMYDTHEDASISGMEGDLERWIEDDVFQQENEVDWQHDPYHGLEEEPIDMFVELDELVEWGEVVADEDIFIEEVVETEDHVANET